MSKNGEAVFCLFCFLLGAVAPWGLIIGAAVVSWLATSDYWAETAAWMAAFGLLLMAVSYMLARISDVGPSR